LPVASCQFIIVGTHYKDLFVWQKAIALAERIYVITKEFPSNEMYGMISQMRRAAVSVPSNIAEGQARDTPKEFVRFIAIAQGSLAEFETQIIIAKNIAYMTQQQYLEYVAQHNEVSRMLASLKNSIQKIEPIKGDKQLETKNTNTKSI